jgi:hypothetical protein
VYGTRYSVAASVFEEILKTHSGELKKYKIIFVWHLPCLTFYALFALSQK